MKTTLTAFLIIFSIFTFAQVPAEYYVLVKEADSLYKAKNYSESAIKYNQAFATNEGKAFPNDRYNAACSWALANVTDSAFYHLFRLAESISKYQDYQHISTDSDLTSLYSDKRWGQLLKIVNLNKEEVEKDFDKPLVHLLDSIYDEDQNYRKQISEIEKKHGRESEELKAHWKVINKTDSVNLIIISKILDERGWLGKNIIGNSGNMTLFLVIQHSDQKTQEKYLPMMREAVKNGNAQPSGLALLEDRVALRQGKKQIYGSQIGTDNKTGISFVQDLEDPENVDKRRLEVGLQPLADYVKQWDIIWDVEVYKSSKKINYFYKFD